MSKRNQKKNKKELTLEQALPELPEATLEETVTDLPETDGLVEGKDAPIPEEPCMCDECTGKVKLTVDKVAELIVESCVQAFDEKLKGLGESVAKLEGVTAKQESDFKTDRAALAETIVAVQKSNEQVAKANERIDLVEKKFGTTVISLKDDVGSAVRASGAARAFSEVGVVMSFASLVLSAVAVASLFLR